MDQLPPTSVDAIARTVLVTLVLISFVALSSLVNLIQWLYRRTARGAAIDQVSSRLERLQRLDGLIYQIMRRHQANQSEAPTVCSLGALDLFVIKRDRSVSPATPVIPRC